MARIPPVDSGLRRPDYLPGFASGPAIWHDSLYWLMRDGRVLAFDTEKKNARILDNSFEVINHESDEKLWFGSHSWFGVDNEQLQRVYVMTESIVIVAYDFTINNWKVVHTVPNLGTDWFGCIYPIWLVKKRLLFLVHEPSKRRSLAKEVFYEYDLQTRTYTKTKVFLVEYLDRFKSFVPFVPTLAKVRTSTLPYSGDDNCLRDINVVLDKFKQLLS